MNKTLLEKMFLKPDYTAAILNMPDDLKAELQSSQKIDTSLKNHYNFILAFYSKAENLEKEILEVKKASVPNGLLWIAYPKNKALETDINRDILHELMKKFELDGVSLVSLNSTWSAMRFKAL